MKATVLTRAGVLVLAASTLIGPAAAATAAPPPARDGQPTREACAGLGFRLRGPRGETVPGALGSAMGTAQAPAFAPPPSPPPPPAMAPPFMANHEVMPPSARVLAPPSVGEPEHYPDARPNRPVRVAEAPVSTFSIDVDTASYANVRRFLTDGQRPPADAVRVEEMINYFDYDYPRPADRNRPFATFVGVAPAPWSPDKAILHLGIRGFETPRAAQPPLNLTFLVDVSGSMIGPDRLALAKQSINLLIDRLRPQDRVSLVVYAGAAGVVLEPTPGADRLKMRCAVEALEAGGSTAGGAGLALAYDIARRSFVKDGVNRIVLMTDGDFNVGVTENSRLEDYVADQRKSGVYLSVFGFGRGNYQDARMQAVAQAGNGSAGYVDSLAEARRLFDADFGRQIFPIADDVKIQVEFNPARVAEYRLIGYETRLLNREDFNNDQVDAGEVGAGATVTALYELTWAGAKGSVDPLRYRKPASAPAGRAGEIAFLRIRYKPPGGKASSLIERPVTDRERRPSLQAAAASTRWAAAVAAFGQRLRGDPAIPARYGWADIRGLASGAKGVDAGGYRAQFIRLVDMAEKAKPAL